ncbi:MAG: response regulator [Vicinamibacteria bacterium]
MVKKNSPSKARKARTRNESEKDSSLLTPRTSNGVEEPVEISERDHPDSVLGNRASAGGLDTVENLRSEAPLGHVMFDDVGTIRECDKTASVMLGIDPGSVPGSSIAMFAPPSHQISLLDHLLKCRSGANLVRSEVMLRRSDGTLLPCQLLTRPATDREEQRIYRTAILDLTDRRRVEEALRATERRFSAAVEASGAGVFELQIPFEGLIYLSHRLAEILGYTWSELAEPAELPDWIGHRLHRDDRELLRGIYQELATGQRGSSQADVRFRHKNGSWRWIRIWAKAADPRENSSRDLVGVAMDVTFEKERAIETERRARQLRALAAELYHVEERERRELATELHDNLAQLIVATKMKLGVIAPSQDAQALRQQVDEALQLLDRADESVRSLTFSLSPPVLDELGLTSAVKWLAKDMEKQFGLEVALKEEGELEVADPRLRFMLFRSIRELLINSAKHAHTRRARVVLESDGSAMRVVVEDKGRGFDLGQARAEGSRGFGLFSIQERVESIGGKMIVRSAPGHGTSVTILLEKTGERLDARRSKTDPVIAGPPRPTAQAERRERIRVLLADDHELVRSALARLLDTQADLQVIGEASDGESALELVGLLTPDVVVMDVTMTGVGGIEATRRISAEYPEARVIGLSMHESSDIASAMRDAGAFEYLRKSSPTHVLLDTIRKAAGHPRQTSA